MTVSQIETLQKAIICCKMDGDSPALIDEMRNKLGDKYENALKGVHTNKIFHLSDGRWKTKNPQIAKKTKFELLEALYEYYFGKKVLSVESVYEQWIENYKKDAEMGHRSILSYTHYKSDWARFFHDSNIAKMDITAVKPSMIKTHYKALCSNGAITRKTLNNAKTILNHVFDYAVDNDYIVANFARSVSTKDLYCKEVNNELKVYTDKERDKIITQASAENDVFARAIILMFCSCTRIGEIRALKWEDVDFEKKTMYIHREIVRRLDSEGHEIFVCVDHTKSGLKEGNRVQPLSDKAIAVLKIQRRKNPFGDYVFLYNNSPLISNTINHHLKRICERAGVEYMSSHKIRFWAVTNMYAKGMQPADIQRLAGHADPTTTDHYKRPSRLGNYDDASWNEMFG